MKKQNFIEQQAQNPLTHHQRVRMQALKLAIELDHKRLELLYVAERFEKYISRGRGEGETYRLKND